MDGNNPEESFTNGTKTNSFCESERIVEPSTSQQPIYLKKKSPNKTGKKGKAKILSVVQIKGPVKYKKENRHIPIILKKSHKFKSKVNSGKAFSNLAAVVSNNRTQYNSEEKKSTQNDIQKISGQLNKPKKHLKAPKDNQLSTNETLTMEIPNSFQVKSKNLNENSQQKQNDFDHSNKFTSLFNSSCIQFVKLCSLPKNSELANNLVIQRVAPGDFGNGSVSTPGKFVEIIPNEDNSKNVSPPLQIFTTGGTAYKVANSSGIETQTLRNETYSKVQIANSVRKNVQPSKLVKMKMVSILKANQSDTALTNRDVMHLQRNASTTHKIGKVVNDVTEMETETIQPESECTSVSETSGTLESSGVSFMNKTSSGSEETSSATEENFQEHSLTETESDSFITVSTLDTTTSETEIEKVPLGNETKEVLSGSEVSETEIALANIEGTFGADAAPRRIEAMFENEINQHEIGSNLEIETTLPQHQKESSLNETAAHIKAGILVDNDMSICEFKGKSKSNETLELMTVLSDDIPYNAEVEIDSNEANKSAEVNLLSETPLNNNVAVTVDEDDNGDDDDDDVDTINKNLNEKKRKRLIRGRKLNVDDEDDDDDLFEFDVLREKSERRLFLEKADVEFCRAAQHKVRGIPNYGRKGFNSISKFNYILSMIPNESPATIHALMVACKNRVRPVIDHLRYIQESRQVLSNQRNHSESSSSSANQRTIEAQPSQHREEQLITAAEQVKINTRKKKLSYNVDLSDNYADDSDEDYVPGKDLTPKKKKKKRCKRKHVSGRNKASSFSFNEYPSQSTSQQRTEEEASGNSPQLKIKYEEQAASTSGTYFGNPSSLGQLDCSQESDEDKRIIRYNKSRGGNGEKRPNSWCADEAGKQSQAIYKAEPMEKTLFEVIKFKKRRPANSRIVPPLQNFIFSQEGVEPFRYVKITKQ